jgi:hypothetical protein
MLAPAGAEAIGFDEALDLPVNMSWTEGKHFEMTSAVFLGLMERAQGQDPLPFHWRADRGRQWSFRAKLPGLHEKEETHSVRPDVIIESPSHMRRVFVEVETGTHSVTGIGTGSVINKVYRYNKFVSEYATDVQPPMSHYRAAFRDGLHPMLMIVAHSAPRRLRVANAIAADPDAGGAQAPRVEGYGWVVVTPEEAPLQIELLMAGQETIPREAALRALGIVEEPVALKNVKMPVPELAVPPLDGSWVGMRAEDAKDLHDSVKALLHAVNAYRKAMADVHRRADARTRESREGAALAELLTPARRDEIAGLATKVSGAIRELRDTPCPAPGRKAPKNGEAA